MTQSATPEQHPIQAAIAPGYAFDQEVVEVGALMVDADTLTDTAIRIPLAMFNRHGLVAGATGTGKTKTLQVLAEQLSAAGVSVFAADVKGDLTGLGVPGEHSDKIVERAAGSASSGKPRVSRSSCSRSAAVATASRCGSR